jgi:hypothetical protein
VGEDSWLEQNPGLRNLLRWLAPGEADSRLVRHEALFSNRSFLQGFLRGFWDNQSQKLSCNEPLAGQIRLALSYLGIPSLLLPHKKSQQAQLRVDTRLLQTQYTKPKSQMEAVLTKKLLPYDGLVYNLEVEEDNSYSLANATVHNCWATDSEGFFKRTLIESCVVGNHAKPIRMPSCGIVSFSASLRGRPERSYVMGIDPASESDNLAIVVLEVWPDHRRIVYCWTTNRKRFQKRKQKNATAENDYFHYVANKIRDTLAVYPCARIALDKQGGGISIEEALGDETRLREGEVPILPTIDDEKESPKDNLPGDHILEIIHFANAEWTSKANNGLRLDLESKVLLFPEFDAGSVGLAMVEDRLMERVILNDDGTEESLYDTLEDCVLEIEELKEELASIILTQTDGGRERWDTPKNRTIMGKQVRNRKDRYSALLMANAVAREMATVEARPQYYITGGFSTDLARGMPTQVSTHRNPLWYQAGYGDGEGFGAVSKR